MQRVDDFLMVIFIFEIINKNIFHAFLDRNFILYCCSLIKNIFHEPYNTKLFLLPPEAVNLFELRSLTNFFANTNL